MDVEKRVSSYKRGHSKYQIKLHRAIKKYGFDNFKVTILEECSVDELNEAEIFWINYLETTSVGYNIKEGGSFGRHSEETKKKMSIAKKGIIFSDERKKNMSEAAKKRNNSFWVGKKHSVESRRKMSESQIGRIGRKPSNEQIQKFKNPMAEKYKNGFICPNTGRKHSEETKLKISNTKLKMSKSTIENKTPSPCAPASPSMSSYSSSHKNYYSKLKSRGIKSYLVRGDQELIVKVKEFIKSLKK